VLRLGSETWLMSPIAGQEVRGIVVLRAYGKDSNGDGVALRRCKGGHDLHPRRKSRSRLPRPWPDQSRG
jgi:hypothetical protein